jgi:hypothetical protein
LKHDTQIKLNGMYSKPVDLNRFVKQGNYKILLGENRPETTSVGDHALIIVTVNGTNISHDLLILSGELIGRELIRKSSNNGATWSEFTSKVNAEDKLDKDFSEFPELVNDEEILESLVALWNANGNFRLPVSYLRAAISNNFYKGYFTQLEDLVQESAIKGNYAIVEETKSIWSYTGSKWMNTGGVYSVNEKKGDVVINLSDLSETTKLVNTINTLIESLNSNQFLTYLFSKVINSSTIIFPELKATDKLLLIYNGVCLTQNSDFTVSDGQIQIIDLDVDGDNNIHVFKRMDFLLTKLVFSA